MSDRRQKNHQLQPSIALSVLESIKKYPELNQLVKGFMVESFIKEGNQKVDSVHPEDLDLGGLSITDPCLSWEQTENFLLELAELRSLEKTELPKEALA